MSANIVLVEDTPHTLQLMSYLLQAYGHSVRAFASAEDALEHMERARPDLVIMDIQLGGGMNGYQAVEELHSRFGHEGPPVIAVTAFAMVGDREQAMRAGFTDYLTKPIDPYTFATDIERNLEPALRGAPPSVPATVPNPPSTPRDAGPRVLIVDDLATNVELMRSILEPHGYRVTAASSIEEALRKIGTDRPDLILSDLHIGTESGLDLHNRIQRDADTAGIPFAFNSASAELVDFHTMQSVDVIRRPIEPVLLLARVEGLIREGRKADAHHHPGR